MALNFAAAFGGANAASTAAAPTNANDRRNEPPAQFWINLGYQADVVNDEGKEDVVFVSLQQGIPLDGLKPFEIARARTPNMAKLRQAQNTLLEQFLEEAAKLQPGEAKIIASDDTTGLAVELRRIRGDAEEPKTEENQLVRQVLFR